MKKKIFSILIVLIILSSIGMIYAVNTVDLNHSSFNCPTGYNKVTSLDSGSIVVYSGNDGYFAVAENQEISSNFLSSHGATVLKNDEITVNNIPVQEYEIKYSGKTGYAYGFSKDDTNFIVAVLPNDVSNWNINDGSNIANELISSIQSN